MHPDLPGLNPLIAKWANGESGLPPFSVNYPDGSDVGYRWFAKNGLTPLFAFGHGLASTTFRYSDFVVRGGQTIAVSFNVTNTGLRTGTDTPQVYLTRRLGAPEMRLLGWSKVTLAPGHTRGVSVECDLRLLADFDAQANVWKISAGPYEAALGVASDALAYRASTLISAQTLKP